MTKNKDNKILLTDTLSIAPDSSSLYPKPFDRIVRGRHRHRVSNALGLTKFGVNVVCLESGAFSSARHWHTKQDEFIYVLSGTLTLISDEGHTEMTEGMSAGFPAGLPNGHQVANFSNSDAWYIEIGDRPKNEVVTYPDIDMLNTVVNGKPVFTHKDGGSFSKK
ncbi:MAG: cupin domain-containing protein [Alphaproteobacteria bacterium]|nr:cupin domain-containing protein [Alphaproteobacteria bacterium]|tara:strand:- start:624 stop:1115 length:492 start_codon:yes stop_codon:yes gene_type:complete